jgi:hypothetical protein
LLAALLIFVIGLERERAPGQARPMTSALVTVEGRVVRGSSAGPTVAVRLQVADEQVARAPIPGELELVGDDGRPLTIEISDQTTTAGLDERTQAGPWAKLSQAPDAARLAHRAPGPHVRATLIREQLEPGARVRIRGHVVEGSPAAPSRVRATSITRAKAKPSTDEPTDGRRPLPAKLVVRHGLVAAVLLVFAFAYWRSVIAWPDALAHPGVEHLRREVGLSCALMFAVLPMMLTARPGALVRQFPVFVDREGQGTAFKATMLFATAVVAAASMGLITSYLVLDDILTSQNVLAKGTKGWAYVDGAWTSLVLAGLLLALGYATLFAGERSNARLAALFRPLPSWQVLSGRLREGKLDLAAEVFGFSLMWTGTASETLVVETERGPVRVATRGLVWAVDTSAPAPGPGTRYPTEPGAHVLIAGRLGEPGQELELRASGPESLLLVASSQPDLLAALHRGLWMRRLTLAIPPVVAGLTLLLV